MSCDYEIDDINLILSSYKKDTKQFYPVPLTFILLIINLLSRFLIKINYLQLGKSVLLPTLPK